MAMRYLLHFVHEHIPFRWPEFLGVTSRNSCEFHLISKKEHIKTRPYILIQLKDGSNEESLIQSAKESFLLKDLYELWAESDISLEDLADKASLSPHYLSGIYSQPDQSFRINCGTFGVTTRQAEKIEMIKKMTFLENFQSRPDLKNPKQIYCILEMNEKQQCGALEKEYFFGRHLTSSDKKVVNRFCLKDRMFIANTSMNPLLSFISANTARVKDGDIVYDPFVGSGSLLVAAAHMGGYVIGADIDWLLLHGRSRPSRVGVKRRQEGECVKANMKQYNLEHRYIDVLVSDISRNPFSDNFRINSIITDPPYGVRECSEKIGKRKNHRIPPITEGKVRYPSKTDYTIEDLLKDLLNMAAKYLTLNGRLIYYLPITKEGSKNGFDEFIPSHPSLDLVSYSEQALTSRNYRLMVVMEKKREPSSADKATIPKVVFETNFRQTYFNEDRQPILSRPIEHDDQ